MSDFRSEMLDTENRLNKRMEENEKNNVLSRGEGKYIQSKVGERSYYLTDQFFKEHVSKELYHKNVVTLFKVFIRHLIDILIQLLTQQLDMSTSKSYGIYRKSRISKYATSFLRLTDHQIDTAKRHGDFEILKRLG